jgi:uncharacterized protein (TIGR03067 family)
MKLLLTAAILALALPAVAAPTGDAAKADLDKLQGHWKIKSYEENDASPALLRLLHGPDTGKGVKYRGTLHVQGEVFAFNGVDKVRRAGIGRLDPSKQPKAVDFGVKGSDENTYPAIYQLDGDVLTLCVGAPDRRPTEFKAGAGQVLIRYERIKQ